MPASAPRTENFSPHAELRRAWSMRAISDRLLASPRFRRWVSAFPLTRPIARRHARALFDLCAGFVYSQILAACVQLRVFDMLAVGPQNLSVLADRMALPPPEAERLLAGAVALRLVDRRGVDASGQPRFGLGPLGVAMVGNPGLTAMVTHHRLLYGDLADPVALLRGEAGATGLGGYWAYARADAPGQLDGTVVGPYTALMAASQPLVSAEVLDAYRFGRHRCLLDLGGGDGSFLTAVAARAPDLNLMLFDLPPVAERARAKFAAAGLAGRATAFGGDFLRDALPTGADVVSLVRVVHDHDDAAALAILRAARRALPQGGTLLLAEAMSDTPGAEPVGDAYFGFYLLAMGSGRPRTPARFVELLQQTGFTRARLLKTHTPLLVRVIVADAAGEGFV